MRYSEGISEYFAQERIGKYLGEGETRVFRNDAFLHLSGPQSEAHFSPEARL